MPVDAEAKRTMNWLKKLPHRRTPYGLELRILRRLPLATLVGSLIPLALAMLVRVLPTADGVDRAKHIRSVDIFAIATEITFLTAVFTLAIACVVVYVMKGPAYVADAYPLQHADKPDVSDRHV